VPLSAPPAAHAIQRMSPSPATSNRRSLLPSRRNLQIGHRPASQKRVTTAPFARRSCKNAEVDKNGQNVILSRSARADQPVRASQRFQRCLTSIIRTSVAIWAASSPEFTDEIPPDDQRISSRPSRRAVNSGLGTLKNTPPRSSPSSTRSCRPRRARASAKVINLVDALKGSLTAERGGEKTPPAPSQKRRETKPARRSRKATRRAG
jgi:hypothetical protein